MRHIHLNQTDSTSTYLKEMISSGVDFPDFSLVDAEFQTGGRGQKGNSWESAKGENLTFSFVCHPTFMDAADQYLLSQAIALAVSRTLSEYTDGITVKWPNDIYWKDKKISGTIIECNLIGSKVKDCIVGTGININQMKFESDAPNPVSLAQIIGFTLNRKTILDGVMAEFQKIYEQLQNGESEEIVKQYKQNLYRKEGFYKYKEPDGELFEAEIVDVDKYGYLELRLRDGETRKYEFKEVKFVQN